jgi:hypothetical protein
MQTEIFALTVIKVGTVTLICVALQLVAVSSENLRALRGVAILIIACVGILGAFLVLPNHLVVTHTHAHTVAYVQHKAQSHNQGGGE